MSDDTVSGRSVWRNGVLLGAIVALSVTIYSILVLWLFRPLHAGGFAQPALGVVNAFDHLVQAPGFRLAVRRGLTRTHHSTMEAWLLSRAVNCFGYFGVGFFLGSIWSWAGKISPIRPIGPIGPLAQECASQPQPTLSRRRFLRRGLGISAGGVAAGLGYAVAVEPRWFEITHRTVPLADLPSELIGL